MGTRLQRAFNAPTALLGPTPVSGELQSLKGQGLVAMAVRPWSAVVGPRLRGKVNLYLPGKSTVKFSLPETSSHSKQDFFNP